MNRLQKLCLCTGMAAIIGMIVYPPWVWRSLEYDAFVEARSDWIWNHPQNTVLNDKYEATINLERLAKRVVVAAIACTVVILVLRKKKQLPMY